MSTKDPYSKNVGSWYTDRDEVIARSQELAMLVPQQQWASLPTQAASCSPGIGVASGNLSYDPKIQDWDRNDPLPLQIQEGGIIGQPAKPGLRITATQPFDPQSGGARTVFVQADADYAPGEIMGSVGVNTIFNNQDRTVLQGEWVWAEAIFASTFQWDFTSERALPPEITFTRTTEATYQDFQGRLITAPVDEARFGFAGGASQGLLIEGPETSLIEESVRFSEMWDTTDALLFPNANIAPDGTITATMLQDRVVDGVPLTNALYQQMTSGDDGDIVAISVFFKPEPNAPPDTYLRIICDRDDRTDTWSSATFNATNGDFIQTERDNGSWDVYEAKSEAWGDGWFRASLRLLIGANAGSNLPRFTICLSKFIDAGSSGSISRGRGDPYVGTQGRKVLIYGAQAETEGTTSYIPSVPTFVSRALTASAYTFDDQGILTEVTDGSERITYNPLDLALPPAPLLEAEATNLCTLHKMEGSTVIGTVLATDPVVSGPDGVSTAVTIEELSGNTLHVAYREELGIVTDEVVTFSIYVKMRPEMVRWVGLSIWGNGPGVINYVNFRFNPDTLETNTFQSTLGNTHLMYHQVTPLANGWFRVLLTGSVEVIDTGIEYGIYSAADGTGGGQAGIPTFGGGTRQGFYTWGAQLVRGYGSSPILTSGTQLTRPADVYTTVAGDRARDFAVTAGTDFDFFDADNGTMVMTTVKPFADDQESRCYTIHAGNQQNAMYTSYQDATPTPEMAGRVVLVNTTTAMLGPRPEYDEASTTAYAYSKTEDYGFSSNGSPVITRAVGDVPAVIEMQWGKWVGTAELYLDGYIQSFLYYIVRLPDATLQQISGSQTAVTFADPELSSNGEET